MIDLEDVTVWAACWSGDAWMMERTSRVLRYCQSILKAKDWILFTPNSISVSGVRTVEIPKLDWSRWNIFVNRELPKHINSGYALCVHEDGFPIEPQLWDPKFLNFDYIGAPWDPRQCVGWPKGSNWGSHLLVGNGGFFIESRKMMDACLRMPETADIESTASDVYVCSLHRAWFESQGIKFAPAHVAAGFSTEQTHKECPSFGFHGRRDSPKKYTLGWSIINSQGF